MRAAWKVVPVPLRNTLGFFKIVTTINSCVFDEKMDAGISNVNARCNADMEKENSSISNVHRYMYRK